MTHGMARAALWLLLALPAALMVRDLAEGTELPMDLLKPSGETAVRLIVLALLPGPLSDVFGAGRLLRWWLAVRRNLGVAACTYALLHLAFYVADMGAIVAAMIDELSIPSIWTGWLALALLAIPAAVSSNAAMRALGRRWKSLQRLVYPALVLALAHWLLLGWQWQSAVIHVAPLIVAWSLRCANRRRNAVYEGSPS